MYAPHEPAGESRFWGELCGSETAWGVLRVDPSTSGPVAVTLEAPSGAIAHLLAPDWTEVAELSPEEPTATVEISGGNWTIPVTALSPADRSGFEISFSFAD
jgi:hypothetical protein